MNSKELKEQTKTFAFDVVKNWIENEKNFYLEGWERIKKYYEIQDEEKRDKETKLKNPPHNSIKGKAISFISLSISESEEMRKVDVVSGVLLGVGVELLLKSIILKEDPKNFINSTEEKKQVFSWSKVPGNDDKKLRSFLKKKFDVGWVENAKIRKIDNGEIVSVFSGQNSIEIHLSKNKDKATVKISDDRTYELEVEEEKGELNTYENKIITPSFPKCIKLTCGLLKDVLDKEQLERVNDVLTLINIRRNELAHLHFHQTDSYEIPYQILNVLEFLFECYFSEEREFIGKLSQLKEKNKVGSGMDFEHLKFPKPGVSRR